MPHLDLLEGRRLLSSAPFSESVPTQVMIDVDPATTRFADLASPTIDARDGSTTLWGEIAAGSLIPTGNVAITLDGVPASFTLSPPSGTAGTSFGATAMSVTGIEWPPGMVGHGDGMSGLVFAGGIAAALLGRERTGEPSVVDSSLLGTAMWFNAPAITSSKFPPGQRMFQAAPSRSDLHWTSSTFQTADGRFVMLSMLGDHQNEWLDFCAHIDRPDLADDPRFATAADRAASSAVLVGILDEVFAARTYAEWGQILVTLRGVWAPVQTAAEMHDDPQAVANGMVTDVDYAGGTLSLVSPPVMFDAEPDRATRAPEFGEHTDEVLASAGYPAEAIAKLRDSGVVA